MIYVDKKYPIQLVMIFMLVNYHFSYEESETIFAMGWKISFFKICAYVMVNIVAYYCHGVRSMYAFIRIHCVREHIRR